MQFALDDVPYLLRGLFAALSTLWLWMFFSPMHQLGLIIGMNTFIPFLLALLVAQWIPFVWARVVIALVASEAYVLYYFPPAEGFGHGLGLLLKTEFVQARTLIQSGQLIEPFQTHLFLFALIIIYWLLVYASRRPRLWLFYNGLGILVLGIIDGNTKVHPNLAIVVNCLIAFSVLGLSRYAQLRLHFEHFRWPAARYLGPLFGVMVIASGAAWMLPKAPAAWANPFKNIENGTGGSGNGPGGGPTQYIGYQESNSHLGGSFVMNYTPVLQVQSKVPVYLRGKVYSNYTGKGWLAGTPTYRGVQGSAITAGPAATLTPGAPTKSLVQHIQVLSNRLQGDAIFGAYSISNLKPYAPDGAGPLQVNMANGDVRGNWNRSGFKYTVVSKAIEDPSSLLQGLPGLPGTVQGRENYFAGQVGTQDLQLPRELPNRVRKLTEGLIKGDTTEYQMVQHVDDYLQGFQYQIQNVPVPGKNQDYVDQFLFESQVGYCNNFSSAMAVMLRTVGIPTRWVTGFADPQQNGGSGDPTANKYVVRESDAHSWVEVYFPKYGWIPFDPTPGFNFPYLANPHPGAGSSVNTPPQKSTPKPAATKTPPSSSGSGGGIQIPWQAIWSWTWKAILVLAALGVVLGVAFRKQLLLRLYVWLWKQDTPGALTKGMLRLVSLLRRRGRLPQGVVTVRDLEPAAVQSGIEQDDFRHLVVTVEKTWYSPQPPTARELRGVRRTWTNWVRAIILGRPNQEK